MYLHTYVFTYNKQSTSQAIIHVQKFFFGNKREILRIQKSYKRDKQKKNIFKIIIIKKKRLNKNSFSYAFT